MVGIKRKGKRAMTLKDLLKRVDIINDKDLDKMIIFRDKEGWSNINIKVTNNYIEIYQDFDRPFQND